MSKLTNGEIALGVFDAINQRNFQEFESYISSEIKFDFPGVEEIHGAKKVIIFFMILFRKYKTLEFRVIDIVEADQKACVMWENKGEENDGTLYSNKGLTWFYLKENQIIFMSDYFKDTSFTK